MAKPLVNIDIVSDIICPWCWVGKKTLEAAMKELEDKFQFHIRWLPYMLRPEVPIEGLPIPPGFRSGPRAEHLKKIGLDVGIEFAFKNTAFPNSLRSHALLEFAASKDNGAKQNIAAEKLFKELRWKCNQRSILFGLLLMSPIQAYFIDCKMLTEDDVVEAGKNAGFDAGEVRAYISNQENLDAVKKAARVWADKGVEGVPLFYFNGQRMFSGAQSQDVFKRMLTMASEKFPVAQVSKA